MTFLDFIGLLGVAAIVVSYFLLQAERMRFDDWSYLLMNAFGATAIIVSLTVDFNLSAMAMEGFWLLISGFGIAKRLMRS
jgi:hypothetical protein